MTSIRLLCNDLNHSLHKEITLYKNCLYTDYSNLMLCSNAFSTGDSQKDSNLLQDFQYKKSNTLVDAYYGLFPMNACYYLCLKCSKHKETKEV